MKRNLFPRLSLTGLFLALCLCLSACAGTNTNTSNTVTSSAALPEYSGAAYITLENNVPDFTQEELAQAATSYESYSPLDSLGRCGVAMASVCTDTMPTESRGSISQVKPTGWQSVQYDFVDGKSLYNRCHLIGFQLTGENANEKNLITGTRYLNVDGMLPFENMVADYVKETGNHVLYRVTPLFQEQELVARGVYLEAQSIEDEGGGVQFHVYCYNVQPGVTINYATGESQLDTVGGTEQEYVLNTSGKKFHLPSCSAVQQMSEKNRQVCTSSRENLINQGYTPCGLCKP